MSVYVGCTDVGISGLGVSRLSIEEDCLSQAAESDGYKLTFG